MSLETDSYATQIETQSFMQDGHKLAHYHCFIVLEGYLQEQWGNILLTVRERILLICKIPGQQFASAIAGVFPGALDEVTTLTSLMNPVCHRGIIQSETQGIANYISSFLYNVTYGNSGNFWFPSKTAAVSISMICHVSILDLYGLLLEYMTLTLTHHPNIHVCQAK